MVEVRFEDRRFGWGATLRDPTTLRPLAKAKSFDHRSIPPSEHLPLDRVDVPIRYVRRRSLRDCKPTGHERYALVNTQQKPDACLVTRSALVQPQRDSRNSLR